jgi:phosphoheptose isomerase
LKRWELFEREGIRKRTFFPSIFSEGKARGMSKSFATSFARKEEGSLGARGQVIYGITTSGISHEVFERATTISEARRIECFVFRNSP